MEDALMSPEGLAILTGAGLIDAQDKAMIVHTTEKTDKVKVTTPSEGSQYVEIELSQLPHIGHARINTPDAVNNEYVYALDTKEDYIYVMLLDDHGEVHSEPFIPSEVSIAEGAGANGAKTYKVRIYATEPSTGSGANTTGAGSDDYIRKNDLSGFSDNCVVLVDYYVKHTSGAFQVNITPDKFGGNFYLEASTLFRTTDGVDMPAEFVIPNCKVQSNFTFTMAATGDPSTFTFTMDAFPDYTRWDKTQKVYANIQVIELGETRSNLERLGTKHNNTAVETDYNTQQRPKLEENY